MAFTINIYYTGSNGSAKKFAEDLEVKTIIPFCTSGSSGIETSVNNLRKYNSKLNVLDGKRFSSSASKVDVENWINSIK